MTVSVMIKTRGAAPKFRSFAPPDEIMSGTQLLHVCFGGEAVVLREFGAARRDLMATETVTLR